jgi:nitrate reductase NapAB chaperone NapD
MLISGVIVVTQPEKTEHVLNALQNYENVTTYGIHKDYYIIAVLEGETPKELETLTEDISTFVSGVLGVYPAYVNFEMENEDST